jgi:hypothetical protein
MIRYHSARLASLCLTGLLLLTYSSFILNSYRNPDKFTNITLIHPANLLLLTLAVNFLFRFKHIAQPLPRFVSISLYFIFPLSLVVTILLSLAEYVTPPNLLYSRFPINTEQLALLATASGLVALMNAPIAWLKKRAQTLVLLTPIILLLSALIVHLWPNDIFKMMVEEDHIVENTQFLFLVIACVLSAGTATHYFKNKNKFLCLFYLIICLGLFFLAGEEISWGQRILGLQAPTTFVQDNSQQEINVHNLKQVDKYISLAYILLGLYGSGSWLLLKIKSIRQFSLHKHLIIPSYLALFFLPTALYNTFFPPTSVHKYGEWSEVIELLLYAGMLVFVGTHYFSVRRKITH